MLTDRMKASIDRISEMGREEITKTHAAGESVVVSDRLGHYVRLFPDGTVAEVTKDELVKLALEILDRAPDVEPDPGDELPS